MADAILIRFPVSGSPRCGRAGAGPGRGAIFGTNIARPEQLAGLTAQIRSAARADRWAIDEEGGDVTRIAT